MVILTSCAQNQHVDFDKLPKPKFNYENGLLSDYKLNFAKDSVIIFLVNNKDSSDTYKGICNDFKDLIPYIDNNVFKSYDSKIDNFNKYLVCGLIADLENFNNYNFPIHRVSNGFRFGNTDYKDNSDGIYLEYDNAIILIGNSYSPMKKLLYDRWLNSYQYFITHNEEIIGFGNLKNNQYNDSLFCDIKKIRKVNYKNSFESDLIKYHISYQYTLNDSIKDKMNIVDSLLHKFINTVGLNKVEQKISCFIHYNQDEIQIAGGYPLPGEISGRVNDNILHVLSFDTDVIIHESIHKIFDEQTGNPVNTFFNEGVPKYWEFTYSPDKYYSAIEKVLLNDTLDFSKIVNGQIDFWSTPQDEIGSPIAYEISGLFVHYLISRYGIKKYKELYISNNLINDFYRIYNLSLKQCIVDWKDELRKFTNHNKLDSERSARPS